MTAVLDQETGLGNRGSHYNRGSGYLYYVNESPGQIWRQPVNPATLIVQQAARTLTSGQSNNLNSIGAGDLRWVGGATKQVQAQNLAKVLKLSEYTALDQIPPEELAGYPWDAIDPNNNVSNEDGMSAAGNFYAVRIPPVVAGGDPHYAMVRIFRDGVTRIEWATYFIGTRPSLIHTLTGIAAPRDIIVNDLETEIYVSGGVFTEGYVVKFQRIVGEPSPQFFTFPIYVSDPGSAVQLLSPHQMVEDSGSVYVVAEGGLFLIQNDAGAQFQVPVVSGISAPVGLLLDKQILSTTAYISNQAGEIYVVDISQFNPPRFDGDGSPSAAVSAPIPAPGPSAELALGGPSGFLTWADDAHSAFYATVGGPTGKIKRIDLRSSFVTDELTSTDPAMSDPWSIEVFAESSLTVVCSAAIFDLERELPISGDLALGLGLIPFGFINNSEANPADPTPTDGRITTPSTPAPGYYFSQYPNLAFGGSLSLLINHEAAWNSGLRYYKVSLDTISNGRSRIIKNPFTDLVWRPMLKPPRFEAVTVPLEGDLHTVRNPADFWYNPYLAAIIGTGVDDFGHNRLKLQFYNSSKTEVVSASRTRLIYVDNTRSSVSLYNLRRGTPSLPPAAGDYQAPDVCGLIAYDPSKDDRIEFDFTAVHPAGGKYTLSFYRGSAGLFSLTGDLTESATLLTAKERSPGVPLRIGHLTGNCDIANISVRLSATAPAVINGYGWVNLGSYAAHSFTLAKPPLTHSDWPPPQPLMSMGPKRPAIVMGPPLPKK